MPCYLGNSHFAKVVYSGHDFTAAAHANESRNRAVVGQLLLLLQRFPVELNDIAGVPWELRQQFHKEASVYVSSGLFDPTASLKVCHVLGKARL